MDDPAASDPLLDWLRFVSELRNPGLEKPFTADEVDAAVRAVLG